MNSSSCPRMRIFWLRSVVGERGKWSGGRRGEFSASQPERNVPPPSRRRKPAAIAAICQCPLVTSAFFAKRNRRGRRAKGRPSSLWSEVKTALVTATYPGRCPPEIANQYGRPSKWKFLHHDQMRLCLCPLSPTGLTHCGWRQHCQGHQSALAKTPRRSGWNTWRGESKHQLAGCCFHS